MRNGLGGFELNSTWSPERVVLDPIAGSVELQSGSSTTDELLPQATWPIKFTGHKEHRLESGVWTRFPIPAGNPICMLPC